MTDDTQVFRYCELDINRCALTYGSAPCTAAVGVTGETKCYNSPRTCQDPANYDGSEVKTIRWSTPTGSPESDVNAIPSIRGISRRPQRLAPGESLGVRESVTVSFGNHKHNDVGFDNYPADRTGNPYDKGTFWGKFFARFGSLEGSEFRTIDVCKSTNKDTETIRHYIVDSYQGVDSAGRVSITAKDAMKFLDKKKGQAPAPNNGVLLADITDTSNQLTLSPAGIGDLEYSASGVASIGDERMTFTRAGDVVTLFNRGSKGSKAESHDAGETFQEARVYDGVGLWLILFDLIRDYTEAPIDYIDTSQWFDEWDNYIGNLYTAEIMRPTPVKTLIEELAREIGFAFYTDVEKKKFILKALRTLAPTATINDDVALAGSIKSKRLTEKRVDRLWIWYAKFNPLQEQGQSKNYKSVYAQSSGDPVVALENNPPAIRDVFSRWIPSAGISSVQYLADRILSRYEKAPREFSFAVKDGTPLALGEAVSIQSRLFEDSEGNLEPPFKGQVISMDNKNGFISVVAEEIPDIIIDETVRLIQIDSTTFNVNLRALHDTLFTTPQSGDTVRLIISTGAIIGSTNTNMPALDIGSWPAGVTIELDGVGRIQGRGGDGELQDGQDGGDALKTTYAIDIIGDLEIWSGGGGGAGVQSASIPVVYAAGGGGAGTNIGITGSNSNFTSVKATDATGGRITGSNTSFGGGPGNDATGGLAQYTPGLAGNAIDGVSHVTITGTVDIRGYQIG